MTIISHVCAEFHDAAGNVLYRIRPDHRKAIIMDAPESIRQDPLFDMLVHEGSLEVAVDGDRKDLKRLENRLGQDAPEMKPQEEKEATGSAAPADEVKTSGRKSAEKK